MYLFYFYIFGCAWSSLLHTCFLEFWLLGAALHRGAQASHCSGFPCGRAQATAQAQSLWHEGLASQVMWTLTGPGIHPVSPALAGGFLTTRPSGKSACIFLNYNFVHVYAPGLNLYSVK